MEPDTDSGSTKAEESTAAGTSGHQIAKENMISVAANHASRAIASSMCYLEKVVSSHAQELLSQRRPRHASCRAGRRAVRKLPKARGAGSKETRGLKAPLQGAFRGCAIDALAQCGLRSCVQ